MRLFWVQLARIEIGCATGSGVGDSHALVSGSIWEKKEKSLHFQPEGWRRASHGGRAVVARKTTCFRAEWRSHLDSGPC